MPFQDYCFPTLPASKIRSADRATAQREISTPLPRCPRSPKRWEGGSVGLRQSRGRRALRVWRIPRASVYRSRKEDAAEYDRLSSWPVRRMRVFGLLARFT